MLLLSLRLEGVARGVAQDHAPRASKSQRSHSDVTVDETAYSYRHTSNLEPQLPPFCASRGAHFRCSPTLPNPRLHLLVCPTQCNCCLVCCHTRHIDKTCCPSAVRYAVLELHPNASADWKRTRMRCLGHHRALSRKSRGTSEFSVTAMCAVLVSAGRAQTFPTAAW